MQQLSGQQRAAEFLSGDTHVGGFTDLCRLQQEGKLDRILNHNP